MLISRRKMTDDLELDSSCELIHESAGIKVFYDKGGVKRAVFDISGDEEPYPHCDPNKFGYALVAKNFVDLSSGFALCEVVHLEEFLAGLEGWGAEVVENL